MVYCRSYIIRVIPYNILSVTVWVGRPSSNVSGFTKQHYSDFCFIRNSGFDSQLVSTDFEGARDLKHAQERYRGCVDDEPQDLTAGLNPNGREKAQKRASALDQIPLAAKAVYFLYEPP